MAATEMFDGRLDKAASNAAADDSDDVTEETGEMLIILVSWVCPSTTLQKT